MSKKATNSANQEAPEPKVMKAEKTYVFTELGVSVQASSLEAAETKAKKLTENK